MLGADRAADEGEFRPGLAGEPGLFLSGVAFVALGLLWGRSFPVIKNLWTGSFVLLAAFYVLRWRRWAFFLVVIGVNAITIYVVPRFVDFEKISAFFLGGAIRLADSYVSTALALVVVAIGVLAAKWIFLLYLYRNKFS